MWLSIPTQMKMNEDDYIYPARRLFSHQFAALQFERKITLLLVPLGFFVQMYMQLVGFIAGWLQFSISRRCTVGCWLTISLDPDFAAVKSPCVCAIARPHLRDLIVLGGDEIAAQTFLESRGPGLTLKQPLKSRMPWGFGKKNWGDPRSCICQQVNDDI